VKQELKNLVGNIFKPNRFIVAYKVEKDLLQAKKEIKRMAEFGVQNQMVISKLKTRNVIIPEAHGLCSN
jgi:hypothetical protein